MQRLFSAFPDRAPGAGLLLLRTAVGVTLVAGGSADLVSQSAMMAALVTGSVAVLVGLMLAVGVLTPVGALAGAVLGLLWAIRQPGLPTDSVGGPIGWSFFVMVSVAIALLGPGAFSLDAYLFGRREIVIPPQSRATRPL